jgi:hypothetical protein
MTYINKLISRDHLFINIKYIIARSFFFKNVLKDGIRDGNAEHLPKCLEEAIYNTSEKQVSSRSGGLGTEA